MSFASLHFLEKLLSDVLLFVLWWCNIDRSRGLRLVCDIFYMLYSEVFACVLFMELMITMKEMRDTFPGLSSLLCDLPS